MPTIAMWQSDASCGSYVFLPQFRLAGSFVTGLLIRFLSDYLISNGTLVNRQGQRPWLILYYDLPRETDLQCESLSFPPC
jgi:hypothetical protein